MNDDSYYSAPHRSHRTYNPSLESRELEVERKFFTAEIRENERGKYLRLTEETRGRRNTVIVPSCGFEEFAGMINDILATEAAKS